MTALNHNPVYGTYPKTAHAKVSTGTGIANTDLDDSITGGAVLFTAPAGGCAVTRLTAAQVEPALITACQLSIYLRKSASIDRRLRSIAHAAYTWAVTTAPATDDFLYTQSDPLMLEEGDTIVGQARAGSVVTDAFVFTAQYHLLTPDA